MLYLLLTLFSCQKPEEKACYQACDEQFRPLPSVDNLSEKCREDLNLQEPLTSAKRKQIGDCTKKRVLEIMAIDKKYISCLAACERAHQ